MSTAANEMFHAFRMLGALGALNKEELGQALHLITTCYPTNYISEHKSENFKSDLARLILNYYKQEEDGKELQTTV